MGHELCHLQHGHEFFLGGPHYPLVDYRTAKKRFEVNEKIVGRDE